jgi:hypothetical protein
MDGHDARVARRAAFDREIAEVRAKEFCGRNQGRTFVKI